MLFIFVNRQSYRKMGKKILVILISIMTCCLYQCNTPINLNDEIRNLYEKGEFNAAQSLIQKSVATATTEQQAEWKILDDKMNRIRLDFSKNEEQIKAELLPYFPDLSAMQMENWEKENQLEMRWIDGEKRYFKNAVPNLFRLDSAARARKESIAGKTTDPLKEFCLENTASLINKAEKGINLLSENQKFKISFTIELKPDVVPADEIVKCWMPFPRESLPRQKNVKLIAVNSDNYILADNSQMQRSLYMKKKTEPGKPVVFNYEAEFETSPLWFKINPEDLKEYDKDTKLFREFTAERKPHIVFSNEIQTLADKITNGLTNPIEKVKAIYTWIDSNIPWASALEYSTFDCIPSYVLQHKHGDCGMKTLLFMTMARYSGIPCKWQSGWMLHPGEINLHDWCEVYFEGVGWIPVDQSFGLQNSDNMDIREFYISGIDQYRMIINDDYGSAFSPKKQFYRSEPVDFQRGELEWSGGNLYFDQWKYHLDVTYLND